MEIKFNANAFTIPSNEQGQYHATSLSQAWAEVGGQVNALQGWVKSLSEIYISKFCLCTSKARNDRGGGTWVNKRGLLAFAAYCSDEFEDAVYEAFIALTEGRPLEAAAIAESVAVSDELKQKYERTEARFDAAVNSLNSHNMRINYRTLRCKAVTGYTPKQLTNGTASAKAYMIEQESSEGLSAGIAAMEMIITGIQAGIGYHVTAAMMKVLTGKNKELLAANDAIYKEAA